MKDPKTGFIFIVGNMFGSKTSEMIHGLYLEEEMGRKAQAFKASLDKRYDSGMLTTHSGMTYPAADVKNTSSLINRLDPNTEVLGIDEVQFFDDPLKDFILENKDKYLIFATALQLDFRGNPFPLRSREGKEIDSEIHVGDLMPHAKIITRYPQCTYRINGEVCRSESIYIQRFKEDGTLSPYYDPTVVVGGTEKYSPRCMEHFVKPTSEE